MPLTIPCEAVKSSPNSAERHDRFPLGRNGVRELERFKNRTERVELEDGDVAFGIGVPNSVDRGPPSVGKNGRGGRHIFDDMIVGDERALSIHDKPAAVAFQSAGRGDVDPHDARFDVFDQVLQLHRLARDRLGIL